MAQSRTVPTVNPRSITAEERRWLAVWSIRTQERLLDLVAERHGYRVACMLVGYMAARHAGKPATVMSGQTKATYRRILEDLAAEGHVPPLPPNHETPIIVGAHVVPIGSAAGRDGRGPWEQQSLVGTGISRRERHARETHPSRVGARIGHVLRGLRRAS